MINEDGIEMTEKDLLKDAMDHLSDASCFLFEGENESTKALAFMVDSALKYAQVLYHGEDVLLAAADYSAFENKVHAKKNTLKVIK